LPVPTVAGHALDPGRSWIDVPIDLLHVAAAAVWIGGLFALALVVPREGAPDDVIESAARRFSKLALASVLLLAVTGVGRALAELSAVSQLWTTGYGRAILAKTGLFVVLLALVSVARVRARAGGPLAPVGPSGARYRCLASVRAFLTAPAQVTIRAQSVQRNFQGIAQPKWFVRRAMLRGWQQVTWRPSPQLEPTTYAVTVWVTSGNHTVRYGRLSLNSDIPPGPVVRILGVDANFDRSSYAPGEAAQLTGASDAVGL